MTGFNNRYFHNEDTNENWEIPAMGIFTEVEAWNRIMGSDYTKPFDEGMKVWYSTWDLVEDFEPGWKLGGWPKADIKMWAPWRGVCNKGVDFSYFEDPTLIKKPSNFAWKEEGGWGPGSHESFGLDDDSKFAKTGYSF